MFKSALIAALTVFLMALPLKAGVVKTEQGPWRIEVYTDEDIECFPTEGKTFAEYAEEMNHTIMRSELGLHTDGKMYAWAQMIDAPDWEDAASGFVLGFPLDSDELVFCILSKGWVDTGA